MSDAVSRLLVVSYRPYRTRRRPTARRRRGSASRPPCASCWPRAASTTSTVEEVADRAGVARATLYQHFRSRLELVDAICETFDENPALLELRDSRRAPRRRHGARRDDRAHRPLLVVRRPGPRASSTASRRSTRPRRTSSTANEPTAAANATGSSTTSAAAHRLRPGLTPQRALTLLLVLTSYDTYRELREAGLSDRQATTPAAGDRAHHAPAGLDSPGGVRSRLDGAAGRSGGLGDGWRGVGSAPRSPASWQRRGCESP